jgi:hypothetical protein
MGDSKAVFCCSKFSWAHESVFFFFRNLLTIWARVLKVVRQPWSRAVFLAVVTVHTLLHAQRPGLPNLLPSVNVDCLRSGALLGCDLAWSGNSLPPVRDILSVLSSRVKKSNNNNNNNNNGSINRRRREFLDASRWGR